MEHPEDDEEANNVRNRSNSETSISVDLNGASDKAGKLAIKNGSEVEGE